MSVPEQSLITEEHRAQIGKKSDPVKVIVDETDAHRMRDVLSDADPRTPTAPARPRPTSSPDGQRPAPRNAPDLPGAS